jgi:hypothetical protein
MSSVDDIFAAWEYLQHTLFKLGESWSERRTEFLSGTGTYKWTGLVPDLKTLVQGSLLWMADGSIAWIRTTEGVKSSKLRVCTLANPQGSLRSIEELSLAGSPNAVGMCDAGVLVDAAGRGACAGDVKMARRAMTIDVPIAVGPSGPGQPVFRIWDTEGEVIVEAAMLSAMCDQSLQPRALLSAFVEGQAAWVHEARSVEAVPLLAPAGANPDPPFGEGSTAQLYSNL